MINCSQCFAAVPDDMFYCLNCGARMEIEQETYVRPKPPPPRIIIMPPIPSRTEIAFTWIAETVGRFAWALIGAAALLVGAALAYLIIYALFLHQPKAVTF